ncbi:MAG: hypothetical protein RQ729_04615 [Wenzhouxiangellaceae bacterium]|nr:hypothetical protein [Wenzhouxiangellaceae bacterium]
MNRSIVAVLVCAVSIGLWMGPVPIPANAQSDPPKESAAEIEQLRRQIVDMQAALQAMQAQLNALQAAPDSQAAPNEIKSTAAVGGEDAPSDETLEQRLTLLEQKTDELAPDISLGGAMRLNYAWRDFDDQNKDRVGDFELELFRINFDGSVGDVILSTEWRRYNDFQAIHHAWVGYDFSESVQGQLGISQVPFGLLPYASHSFWFGGTYYLGFEDDYDTGIKFVHTPSEDWTFHYAFYKNPEYANDGRFGRYSFDLVTAGDQQNAEINQLNLRGERHLALSPGNTLDLGISLEGGQIYNRTTENKGDRYAVAAHANATFGPWNLQLQGLRYEFNPDNPIGVSDDFVQTGAFDFPFLMAARGEVLSANVARGFNTSFGPITGITCYNDFTFINPSVDDSADSVQNVTGCSVAAGGVFAYFDYIIAKNMWFAGGDGIGLNRTTAGDWKSRLNINIGYYF